MTIVDLRQLSSRQIEPLLTEEAQRWREELRWDYRASLDLIKKFVEARSLAGCAALENGEAAGYEDLSITPVPFDARQCPDPASLFLLSPSVVCSRSGYSGDGASRHDSRDMIPPP